MVPFEITALRVGAGVIALIGLLSLGLGTKRVWLAIDRARSDPAAIASVPNDPGLVEIEGVAGPDDGTVESPFSGANCLVCEWEVQERRRRSSGKGSSTYWKTLDSGLLGGPFRVTDDTGSLRVEPAGSTRHLETQSVTVPGGTTPPDRIREFIAANPDVDPQDGQLDLKIATLNVGNDQRYVERRLDPEEDCYVLGWARYDQSAGSAAGEVNAVVEAEDGQPFVIADGPESVAVRRMAGSAVGPVTFGVACLGLAAVGIFWL